jgi:hypothetical protein
MSSIWLAAKLLPGWRCSPCQPPITLDPCKGDGGLGEYGRDLGNRRLQLVRCGNGGLIWLVDEHDGGRAFGLFEGHGQLVCSVDVASG